MSFFNKVLASIGIGSARVDTKLEKDTVFPGEKIKGIVEILGGNVEQRIDEIYLSLHTTYLKHSDEKKYKSTAEIDHFRLNEPFTIGQKELKQIPFTFQLPFDTPISLGKTTVWVETGLDIKNAVDPADKDYLKVLPNQLTEEVLNVVTDLGFRLREVECEEAHEEIRRRLPFIQEFELIPISGPYRGRIDQLKLGFFPTSFSEINILMHVVRKARGVRHNSFDTINSDVHRKNLKVTDDDLPNLKDNINSIIHRFS